MITEFLVWLGIITCHTYPAGVEWRDGLVRTATAERCWNTWKDPIWSEWQKPVRDPRYQGPGILWRPPSELDTKQRPDLAR